MPDIRQTFIKWRKSLIMNKGFTNLLCQLYKNHNVSQRHLSSNLGISLGQVNRMLKFLKKGHLINYDNSISENGRNYIYKNHPNKAVILAAGYGLRMVPINTEEPKGLLNVRGQALIERLIEQLQAVGVNNIYIVVGFMKEHYEYLIDKYNAHLIVNTHYDALGNIYSLYLAKEHLQNCYVLPCDLWFAKNPFSRIEDDSWYMFSDAKVKESQLRVGRLGKVKHVERNGNQMIGVAYFNEEGGKHLADDLISRINDQDHLEHFWESVLDEKGTWPIPGYIIPDDTYAEINSYEQLRDLDSNSNHLKNDAIDVISQTLDVQAEDIRHIQVVKKGMTNRSFKFECHGQRYIFRIPGKGTEKLINRQYEYDVYQVIEKLPYVEKVLYLNPQNGYKLSKFIKGARSCDAANWDDVTKSMNLLKKFHSANLKVDHTFNLRQQTEMYEQLRDSCSAYRDYDEVKGRVSQLWNFTEKIDKQWTLCHIDANANNFLFDENGQEYLIDWEYAGMQDPDVDVAMFAIYSMYDQKQIDHLMRIYYGDSITNQIKYKFYAYIAICGLLWSNWCEYKQSLGLDFGEYSLAQYRYAKEYSRKVIRYLKGQSHGDN